MLLLTMGGSTNGILHLQAIYHEAGLGELPLSVFDEFSRRIPQVASIYPASEFDMVDFYEGGGVPAVLKEIEEYLHKDTLTVSGLTMGEALSRFSYTNNRNMIKSAEEPFAPTGGVAILKGNIAPLGCVIKPAAVPKAHVQIFRPCPGLYHRGGILSGRTGRQSETRHLHGPDVRGAKRRTGYARDV